jgi:hypothetical protein
MTLATASKTAVALDPELVAFMQGGVSMHAASRDANLVANLSRPLGCRVSADRTRVTIFLLASHSGGMVADFRANGRIAVVFSLPSTHRTIQLKGEDAAQEPLQEGDHIVIARHRAAFVAELASLRYDPSLPEKLMAGSRGDVLAVSFTVTEAFIQTPGPTAGTPLPK